MLRISLTRRSRWVPGLLAVALLVPMAQLSRASGPGDRVSDVLAPAATASPSPRPSAQPRPLTGITIAIDPGHNGGNGSHPEIIRKLVFIGTKWKPCNMVGTSTRDGFTEHRMNWLVANRVKSKLQALGATVKLTRTSDTGVGPCVTKRGQFGEKVGAVLEVSIHGDGSAAGNRGFFVMRPGKVKGWTDDIYVASGRLATAVRDGLKGAGLPVANYYAKNGLITRTDLGTLNCSDVPVVEVELGNMKNASDAKRMKSSAGRDQYADGLVAGIRKYLGK